MDIIFFIVISVLIIYMPLTWLETSAYKKVINEWREKDPLTYKEAGSPSEYLALSNLRIKYNYIMSFDYIRKVKNAEVKSNFKKHHVLFFLEHIVLLFIFLCAIYC